MLLCLAVESDSPKSIATITKLALSAGLLAVKKWNVSAVLLSATGLAIRVKNGWRLTDEGKQYLVDSGLLVGVDFTPPSALTDLKSHLSEITHADAASFVNEAIGCFERQFYRASVVLSWIGAMSILYEHVISKRLQDFNIEVKRRDAKWRDAKTADDLARIKENDFLDVLEALSIIGKNVKQELQGVCLKLRNACGHPNSLEIKEQRVAAHLELLVLNVFSKF